MKPLSENAKLIENQIKKNAGSYTLGDIAATTGLPMLETKYGLKEVLGTYKGRINVTENGDLIYNFGKRLSRRGAKSWAERREEWGALLWRAFKLFYKVLISLFLIVYFIFFVVLIVVLLVAAMSGSKDNRRGGGGGNLVGLVGKMFNSIFRYNTHYSQRYKPRDPWGYPYEHYEPRKTHWPQKEYKGIAGENPKNKRLKEKSFIASIYDFVLGPPRVELNPLRNQQEVASYLKQTKGIISISEVQALAGWTREEAEDFTTNCIVEFDGQAEINDNGTLFGEFDEVLRSAGNDKNEYPIEFFWDEYEPEYELTGNSKTRNLQIIGMNIFNFAVSAFVISSFFTVDVGLGAVFSGFLTQFAAGYFPFIYSISFFLIPFIRSFYIRRKQREQHIQNIRKRLMKVIFRKHKEYISLAELTETANDWRSTEEKLDEKTVEKVLSDFIIDLGGEISVNENAEMVCNFQRLNQELTDMEQIRKIKIMDNDPGKYLNI